MAGTATLPCYGGPLNGRSATIADGSRFGWLVSGRLVSNTATVEWVEIRHAEGVYLRATQQGMGRHNATREVLIYKPAPGTVPTVQ
jgi:hypothetical protein